MVLDRLKQLGVAVATAIVLCASSAGAATVQVIAKNQAALDMLDPGSSLDLGGGVWNPARTPVVGSSDGLWRSPWEGDVAFATTEYWTAGPTGAANQPNPASLVFASGQSSISFLWGSVDTYNELNFYDEFNNVIDTVLGASILALGADAGSGAALVAISNIVTGPFFRVDFHSIGENAFEFSNIAVPLPGALILLLTAIGGLGVFGRLKARVA